jgi:acetyl esterase/lipase
MAIRVAALSLVLACVAAPLAAQSTADWTAVVSNDIRVAENITYLTASNWDAKLDVYTPRSEGPHPTVLHIHGGGWVNGSRESIVLRTLPWLEMGFAVVNVSYRLGRVALAPAAVEDCLCALKWIARNAKQYGFDVNRIVTTGYSAGGHLALTTAMLPRSLGLDSQCPGTEPVKVAAVVNWFGITDVADLLQGENVRSYAVQWFGGQQDRLALARRISPLTHVQSNLPPVLTIHGDADPTVPYAQAVKFHEALGRAGVPTELVTIPNGKHGNFPAADQVRAVNAMRAFLRKHVAAGQPAVNAAVKDQSGRTAYERVCEACHGAQGAGKEAPRLVPLTMEFDALLAMVREGGGQMPPISAREISDQQVRQLASYLKSLTPGK